MPQHYVRSGITLAISFVLMFFLTMSMIRTINHVHFNLSNAYMALVMVAPMALVMMLTMGSMFTNKRLNLALYVGFAVLFIGAWTLGRTETFVGNEQFSRSR